MRGAAEHGAHWLVRQHKFYPYACAIPTAIPTLSLTLSRCYAGIGAVAVALLVGLVRGVLLRTRQDKGGDALRAPLVGQ